MDALGVVVEEPDDVVDEPSVVVEILVVVV